MKYIVWKNNIIGNKLRNSNTNGGYFVKYKSKLEDEFSNNWFDANRYKTIGPAITRLGIIINEHMSMSDFFDANGLTKSLERDKSISSILDEEPENILIFKKGFIDRVDENGNFAGNAGKEVIEYIENYIQNSLLVKELACLRIQKKNIIKKKFEKINTGNYIDTSTTDEEFWKEVLKD